MFTGIVEEIGRVKSLRYHGKNLRISIAAKLIMEDLSIGDSISVNGACLTVVDISNSFFQADASDETLNNTTFKSFKIGDEINLERAVKADSRFGGHIVSGHVDGIGTIKEISIESSSTRMSISCSEDIIKYLIYKGSLTIDGLSLTISEIKEGCFSVVLIPHTLKTTTLGRRKISDKVNIETDMLSRYVENFLFPKTFGKEEKTKKSAKNSLLLKDPSGFFEWPQGFSACN